jgi:hypothetical protein
LQKITVSVFDAFSLWFTLTSWVFQKSATHKNCVVYHMPLKVSYRGVRPIQGRLAEEETAKTAHKHHFGGKDKPV